MYRRCSLRSHVCLSLVVPNKPFFCMIYEIFLLVTPPPSTYSQAHSKIAFTKLEIFLTNRFFVCFLSATLVKQHSLVTLTIGPINLLQERNIGIDFAINKSFHWPTSLPFRKNWCFRLDFSSSNGTDKSVDRSLYLIL